jgi:hypothetical protein
MGERPDGITGRQVRGWLSRMSPGPWAAEASAEHEHELVLSDAEGELVGTLVEGEQENAGPIAELPRLLRQWLTMSGELVGVEHALRAAGVDEGGVAGITALMDSRAELGGQVRQLQRDFDAQGAGWADTIGQLDTANARVRELRTALTAWGGRALDDEEGMRLYRELAGVLMSTAVATSPEEGAPHDDHNEGA